jgi:hypothetical protein
LRLLSKRLPLLSPRLNRRLLRLLCRRRLHCQRLDQILSHYRPLRFTSRTSSAKTKSAKFTETHMAQFRMQGFRQMKFKKPWSFSSNSFNAMAYSEPRAR